MSILAELLGFEPTEQEEAMILNAANIGIHGKPDETTAIDIFGDMVRTSPRVFVAWIKMMERATGKVPLLPAEKLCEVLNKTGNDELSEDIMRQLGFVKTPEVIQ